MHCEDQAASGTRTVVLGLGNPVLSDDAVGLAVAHAVRLMLEDEPIHGVDVLTSTRAGFELLDLLSGYHRAVIVDALEIPGGSPGRIARLSLRDYAGSARLHNAHELSISAAYEVAARLGVPMPAVTEIVGIETLDVRTISEGLTPAVRSAIVPAARLILGWLRETALDGLTAETACAPPNRAFYPPEQ